MLSFTVRMTFREQDREEIYAALKDLTLASRAEPGCISYVAHWVDGEPATVLIYEQYTDDAALEHHRQSPHFATYAIGVLYQIQLTRSVEHLAAIA